MKYFVDKNRPLFLFISIYLITISYIMGFPTQALKYGAILSLGLIFFIDIKFDIRKINKFDIVVFLLVITIPFQNISTKEKVMAFIFYFMLIIIALEGHHIIKKTKDIFCLYVGSYFGLLTCGLVGMLSIINNHIPFNFNNFMYTFGTIWHNTSGGMFAITAVLGISYYIVGNDKINNKIIYILSIFFAIVGLVYSLSRTTYVMFASFTLSLIFIYIYKKLDVGKRKTFLISTFIILFVLTIIFLFSYVLKDGNYIARFYGWSKYDPDWKTFLFGMGNSTRIIQEVDMNSELMFMQMYLKCGLCGVLSMVVLIGYISSKVFKIKDIRIFGIALSIWVFMIVGSFGEPYMINITNNAGLIPWLMLSAMCFGQNNFM